jgi:hypothetical protein
MRALTVDFAPIEQSMRDWCREMDDHYFNKNTGKVTVLSKRLIRAMATDSDVEREELPEWEARMIPLARKIIIEGATDFVRIPEAFGHPERNWMKQFSDDVRHDELRKRLLQALKGRGACKRFKEILKDHPDDQRRWERFRTSCWKNKIQNWLESLGIIAIETSNQARAIK